MILNRLASRIDGRRLGPQRRAHAAAGEQARAGLLRGDRRHRQQRVAEAVRRFAGGLQVAPGGAVQGRDAVVAADLRVPRYAASGASSPWCTSRSSPVPSTTASTVRRLELRGVGHKYYHEVSDDMFALGPIDLAFEPGEVTFLVGGNGSGKTTFAKLLVGLYPPESGEVFLNGHPVGLHDRDAYRQLFTAVFSDFHLFDRLLHTDALDVDRRGNALIRKLHLQHKVQVRNGAFSTRALSQGQRKRLALVVASLEDRPFLVFDEWAADQDPVFKEVFYREVLPELRAMGKAVLVISHDDRYFSLADRLVRLENGQVVAVEDQRPALARAS